MSCAQPEVPEDLAYEIVTVMRGPDGKLDVNHDGIDIDTALALLTRASMWLVVGDMEFEDEEEEDDEEPV